MKNPNNMFSVIMPCYNSEDYVIGALESVINQTLGCWELIAINDGSTDGTLAILEQFAAADPRIRVFSKENGGYCSAVNYGLDKISGEYFLFMGSDDKLNRNLFAEMHNAIKENTPDMVGFRTLRFIEGDNESMDSDTLFDSLIAESNTTIAQFEKKYPEYAKIFSIRDTSKCYRTALLGDLRYFGKYGLDADGIFSMLFAHRARSFLCVPVDGYYWTLRKDSLSGRETTKEVDGDRLENWIKFYDQIAQYDLSRITEAERSYISYFLGIAKGYSKKINFSDKTATKILDASRISISKLKEKVQITLATTLIKKAYTMIFLHSPRLWVFFGYV